MARLHRSCTLLLALAPACCLSPLAGRRRWMWWARIPVRSRWRRSMQARLPWPTPPLFVQPAAQLSVWFLFAANAWCPASPPGPHPPCRAVCAAAGGAHRRRRARQPHAAWAGRGEAWASCACGPAPCTASVPPIAEAPLILCCPQNLGLADARALASAIASAGLCRGQAGAAVSMAAAAAACTPGCRLRPACTCCAACHAAVEAGQDFGAAAWLEQLYEAPQRRVNGAVAGAMAALTGAFAPQVGLPYSVCCLPPSCALPGPCRTGG